MFNHSVYDIVNFSSFVRAQFIKFICKKRILDGDTVIVERCDVAYNGEIIVALIDDEATVKTFYAEDGKFRLQPENDEYEPIFTDHVRILGKVVASIRYY